VPFFQGSHIYIQRVAKIPKPGKVRDAFGYVTNVYTKPPYRGRGMGAALLQRVKDWAQADDLEFLVVWPSEASGRFYERAGFKSTEAVEYSVRP
jgi:GNAT superfamily N-acetyltransferase